MSYETADSERAGITSLCNLLKQQRCHPDTVEHVREVLTARCCAVNSLAAQLRQRENDAAVFQGMFDRQAAESQQLRNQLDALRHRAERMERIIAEVRSLRLSPMTCDGENNTEVDAYHDGYDAALDDMRDILDAARTREEG